MKIVKITSCKVVAEMWYKNLINESFTVKDECNNFEYYNLLASNRIVWKKDCIISN